MSNQNLFQLYPHIKYCNLLYSLLVYLLYTLPHKQLVHDKWLSTYTDMKYIGFNNANDLECRLNQAVRGSSFIEVQDFTNLLLDYVFDKLADRGLMDFDGDFTTLHYIIKSDARKSTFQNKMLKVKINEI